MKFLMCPPDYYEIAYEINPWMSVRKSVRQDLARTQWDYLYRTLTQHIGAEVELIDPVKGLPDMVFTANAGFVSGRTYIRSNFRHKERQPEAAFFEHWFEERGYKIVNLPKVYTFEGEGDVLRMGDALFCGYHFRSDIQAHQLIAHLLGLRALSVELLDERFYHLDTCFCPINDTTALYYPNAFDPYAQRVLKENIPNIIHIRLEEALKFACNSITLDNKIIVPTPSSHMQSLLTVLGYQVFTIELSEFMKAGGTAKCLVLRLES